MALSKEQRREIMGYYMDGRISVQRIVERFRQYPRYKYRHQMWDRRFLFYIEDCFEYLSESKMIELLRAVIEDDPYFPLLRSRSDSRDNSKTFLAEALMHAWGKGHRGLDPNEGNTSYSVLRLLMVRGITREYSSEISTDLRCTPLHQGCEIPGLDPAVLHHLIDLDPGSLRLRSKNSEVPLHAALEAWTPASSAVVSRMVELAPKALFRRSKGIAETPGFMPVVHCLHFRTLSPDLARFLHQLVDQHPGSVQPGQITTSGTALRIACRNAHQDLGLIEAIVRTHPPALCIARGACIVGLRRLPFEVAAEWDDPDNGMPALHFLQQETVEMALAVVECALQSTTRAFASGIGAAGASAAAPAATARAMGLHSSSTFRDDDGSDEDVHEDDDEDYAYCADKDDHATRVDKFRLRVLAAVSRAVLLPSETNTTTTTAAATRLGSMSGFAWAQALREHENRLDVCRELFDCPITSCLVLEDVKFRESVLGTTATNLYRMNKAGGRADPSPYRQIELLASLSDDLDGIYLQFLEFGSTRLVPTGRRRDIAASNGAVVGQYAQELAVPWSGGPPGAAVLPQDDDCGCSCSAVRRNLLRFCRCWRGRCDRGCRSSDASAPPKG